MGRRPVEADAAGAGRARSASRRLADLGLLAALAVAALILAPPLLGLERYVITGDSMSGSYDRGSIVLERAVPVEELRVGDVITYEPPPKAGVEGLVTHRIVSIAEPRGERVFRTAGDANERHDPWRFTLDQPTQARAELGIPWVGYAFAALGVREVRMALIGLPAALIALLVLARLWHEAGEHAREQAGAEAPR